MEHFYSTYTQIMVERAALMEKPEELRLARDLKLRLLGRYCDKINSEKDRMSQCPSWCDNMVEIMTHYDVGYLELFMIDRMIATMTKLEEKEQQILAAIEEVKDSPFLTKEWIADAKARACCWKKEITEFSRADFVEFMDALYDEVQHRVTEAGREARISRELEDEKERRRRLEDENERRDRSKKDAELDKAEKRRQALEEFERRFKRSHK